MQPYNYFVDVPRPNVAPYLQANAQAIQGLQQGLSDLGGGIGAAIQQQRLEEQQRLAMEQAQLYAVQKENNRQALLANPTSKNILSYKTMYPEDATKLEPSFARLADEEKNSEFNALIGPYFAAQTGDVETFKAGIEQRASALEQSKDFQAADRAKILRNIADMADRSLVNAKLGLGARLAYLNPEQFKSVTEYMASGRTAEDIEAAALAKAQLDAKKAAVDVKFAESKAVADLDLTKAQTENYATQKNIAEQNISIARQRLAIEKEANQIKRDAMKAELDAKTAERDRLVRERKADMDQSLSKIVTSKDVILKILKTPRALRESVHGPAAEAMREGYPLATAALRGQDEQDYINLTNQFKGAVFLEGIQSMQNTGAITEKEGTKAAEAIASANLSGSVEAMDEALISVLQLLNRSERIAKEKFGAKPVADAPAPAASGGQPVVDSPF